MNKFNLFSNIIVLVYFLTAITYVLILNPGASGDEVYFLKEFQKVNEIGFVDAIESKISLPYIIINYLPYQLLGLAGVRLTNTLLVFLFTYYVYKRTKSQKNVIFILFYFSTVLFFFKGLNDTIFSLSLAVFFIESYYVISKRNGSYALALAALVISFFTRSLIIVYAPLVLFVIFLLFKSKRPKWKNFVWPSFILILFLTLNLPSLMKNKSLSYDNKNSPESSKSNWVQRQYLSQLYANEGKIKSYNHVSWQETDSFLHKNGELSLPKTIFSAILFDYNLTIKEFLKDSFSTFLLSIRQIGIVYLLMAILLLRMIKTRKLEFSYSYKIIILAYSILVFSLIIISYLELRWLAPAFLVFLVPFDLKKFSRKEIFVNNIILTLVTVYGIFKLIT